MEHVKLFIIIGALVILIILCDKYEERLPPPVSHLFAAWKKLSHGMGIVMSFLILTVLWIIGFGTYAIIIKIITFPRRFRPEPNSYWIECEPSTPESMKHQF